MKINHPFLIWIIDIGSSRIEALRLIKHTAFQVTKGDKIADFLKLLLENENDFKKWLGELIDTPEYELEKNNFSETPKHSVEFAIYAQLTFFKDYIV